MPVGMAAPILSSRGSRTGAFAPSGLPVTSVVMANQGRPSRPEATGTGFPSQVEPSLPAAGNNPPHYAGHAGGADHEVAAGHVLAGIRGREGFDVAGRGWKRPANSFLVLS